MLDFWLLPCQSCPVSSAPFTSTPCCLNAWRANVMRRILLFSLANTFSRGGCRIVNWRFGPHMSSSLVWILYGGNLKKDTLNSQKTPLPQFSKTPLPQFWPSSKSSSMIRSFLASPSTWIPLIKFISYGVLRGMSENGFSSWSQFFHLCLLVEGSLNTGPKTEMSFLFVNYPCSIVYTKKRKLFSWRLH